ncbi:late cornified envelope protein 7A [Talpa occidentalis]|uniref:late cornified envelope protein 7A n=1 Tax=Talpa occidentalis TaxID=50954 RepID=UPI0023F980B5|nr:late cornified envelope protein 7A [Talpa occidentalis]
MSCQQNQQKCQIPDKCLPKIPPKCSPQAPAAPAPCPAPCVPPPDLSSACVASCSISGFGSSCSLLTRIPDVTLSASDCCDSQPSGCPSSCHGPGHCS